MGSVKILLIWGNLCEWKESYQTVNKEEEKSAWNWPEIYRLFFSLKLQAAKQQKGKEINATWYK